MRISTKLALLGLVAGATRTALAARNRKGTRGTGIESAQHGDSGVDPMSDAFAGEAESDRSTAAYGDSDRLTSTETEADTL